MKRLDRIADLAAEYREAGEHADTAKRRLYQALRAERGREDAASLRTLAGYTGLSFARIGQIVADRDIEPR